MPCKYERVRSIDVGRPGHHYIRVGVRKTGGKRGGRTERIGGLRSYKGWRGERKRHSIASRRGKK